MKRQSIRRIILCAVTGAAFLLCAVLLFTRKNNAGDAIPGETPAPVVSAAPIAYVIIDPGHGGKDHGASGTQTGVFEDELNLDVALKLKDALAQYNIRADLTRYTSDPIAPSKKEDMQKRREIMHGSGADLTVSIHMNKFRDSAVHGPMVFYTEGDTASGTLAECILCSICDETGAPRRRTNTGDYYVIRNSKIPAVITECGFLSNSEDERLLSTPEYRALIAQAIADGIYEFVMTADSR